MYSAAMSPPRCPVPRPSSKSFARNFTCARIFSLSISGVPCDAAALPGAATVFPCAATRLVISETQTNASRADKQVTADFFMETPQPRKELFFHAIFEQIFQLAHELLHILKVHVYRREPHVRHFVQLLQPVHDHFADFRGGQLALAGFMHDAFDFVDNFLQFWCGHWSLLARLQEPLQDLLPLEAFPPSILLDHHVRNFVDPFVRREPPAALQAFPPTANGVPAAAFPRINHFVINMRAKRTLHWAGSPCWATVSPAASFSCSAISRNFPKDNPSCASSGAPTRLQAAKVT